MNVLLVGRRFALTPMRYFYDALLRMGHAPRIIGPTNGLEPPFIDIGEATEGHPLPDLILTISNQATVVGALPCPNVRFMLDVVGWNDPSPVDHYPFDATFYVHKADAREYGGEWLPCAYDPVRHQNVTPWASRPIDVVLAGTVHKIRKRILNALEDDYETLYTGHLLDSAYGDLYNMAKMSVCHGYAQNLSCHHFESAALGCLILSDYCEGFDEIGLVDGENYLRCDTGDVAKERIAALSDQKAQRIIANASEWVKPHIWDVRLQTIMDKVLGVNHAA